MDRLYKLDSMDEGLDEKHLTAVWWPNQCRRDGSRSWVPGMAEIDKFNGLNEYYDERNYGVCSNDDGSASPRPDHSLSGMRQAKVWKHINTLVALNLANPSKALRVTHFEELIPKIDRALELRTGTCTYPYYFA